MAFSKEVLDEILKGYHGPDDFYGPEGIMKQLTKALVERTMKTGLLLSFSSGGTSPMGDTLNCRLTAAYWLTFYRRRESKNRAKHGPISTVFYKNAAFSHGNNIPQARINGKYLFASNSEFNHRPYGQKYNPLKRIMTDFWFQMYIRPCCPWLF